MLGSHNNDNNDNNGQNGLITICAYCSVIFLVIPYCANLMMAAKIKKIVSRNEIAVTYFTDYSYLFISFGLSFHFIIFLSLKYFPRSLKENELFYFCFNLYIFNYSFDLKHFLFISSFNIF